MSFHIGETSVIRNQKRTKHIFLRCKILQNSIIYIFINFIFFLFKHLLTSHRTTFLILFSPVKLNFAKFSREKIEIP